MQINFPKRKKEFKKGGLHTDPNIWWDSLLYMALAIMLLSCVFGVYIFLQVNKDLVPSVAIIPQAKKISKERINNVLDYFNKKEERYREVLASPSPIVDPSL